MSCESNLLLRKTYCIFISSYPQMYNGLHARNLQILIHCIALSGSSFRLTTIELKSWISYFRFKSLGRHKASELLQGKFEGFWIYPIKLSTFSNKLHFISSSRKRPKLSKRVFIQTSLEKDFYRIKTLNWVSYHKSSNLDIFRSLII